VGNRRPGAKNYQELQPPENKRVGGEALFSKKKNLQGKRNVKGKQGVKASKRRK
jgi:hypothetical protein